MKFIQIEGRFFNVDQIKYALFASKNSELEAQIYLVENAEDTPFATIKGTPALNLYQFLITMSKEVVGFNPSTGR